MNEDYNDYFDNQDNDQNDNQDNDDRALTIVAFICAVIMWFCIFIIVQFLLLYLHILEAIKQVLFY